MSKLLEGKFALVTGIANRWSLAYAIAQAFAREGATLALTYLGDRQKIAIEELAGDLNTAAILPCDVTKDEELADLTDALRELNRPLHAVVHSLAFANREDLNRPFVETSRDGFLLAQNVSAYSLVALARSTAPLMTEGGSLSTLTYLGATRVVPGYNVMGVAKAALESSMRYLASELGPRNIRVNAISAGAVKTASARAVKDLSSMLEKAPERAPLRRNTDPAEVADTAVFLASDLSRGVTGNCIFVDAGLQILGA
ncbi:MAG: enoyl-ACP reductase [Acidobacteriota bacterium]|nr:enoyl-ACP reductase [Acidobacteriota bacterium]